MYMHASNDAIRVFPVPPSQPAPKRTPERIEFDIESEQEESELEQTAHNLSATFGAASDEDDDDADSSDSE